MLFPNFVLFVVKNNPMTLNPIAAGAVAPTVIGCIFLVRG